MAESDKKPLSVTRLTQIIKSTLEGKFSAVFVEGELSNVSRPKSGHLYFTIKDANAQINAVMFKGNQRGLNFKPVAGTVVRVHGNISVYAPRGSYQILVRRMEEGGLGSLQARFEELKKKLAAEGLFDESRKKPLPLLPQHVGVVTSDTGAAIRDILNVVSRRFPNLHILLAPAKVQGPGAAEQIAKQIDRLNEIGGLDVLIVGRGGGSLEDLWCFNEEIVARAIARSAIPVISAVGHEIDFTISDFTADLRAPTPSAAAELVVGRKDAVIEKLKQYENLLERSMREKLTAARTRLERAADSYVFREPANVVAHFREQLRILDMRGRHRLQDTLRETRQTVDLAETAMRLRMLDAIRGRRLQLEQLEQRMRQQMRTGLAQGRREIDAAFRNLAHGIQMRLQMTRQDIRRLKMQLRVLNPLAVLQRGYSVTTSATDGSIIQNASAVGAGDRIITRLASGSFESEVVTPVAGKRSVKPQTIKKKPARNSGGNKQTGADSAGGQMELFS